MSCFLYTTACPSSLSNPNPNPNPNSIFAPRPNPFPNLCADVSFEFRALERDYMGLGLAFKQEIVDNTIPATLAHKSSMTDPSPYDDDLCGRHLKLAPPSGTDSDDDAEDDGEPLSANIGWPPISSYRRSTTRGLAMKPPCSTETVTPLIVHEAPLEEPATNTRIDDDDAENEAFPAFHIKASLLRKPLHIKVSMDGTPIMRKLDLESMQGYHHLSLELHNLFKFYKRSLSCEVGVHSRFKDSDGASFLLTYKDKNGNWMLVGNTPWEIFAQSARRIRIMKKK